MTKLLRLCFRPQVHSETLQYFLVALVGGMLPLVAGALLARAFSIWQGWHVFWENGEFYLYSASFYVGAIYLLFTNKKKNVSFVSVLFWIGLLALVLSAFLYAALATSLIKEVQGITFDKSFLLYSSVVSLALSLLASYISEYIDNLKRDVDAADEGNRSVNDLVRGLQ